MIFIYRIYCVNCTCLLFGCRLFLCSSRRSLPPESAAASTSYSSLTSLSGSSSPTLSTTEPPSMFYTPPLSLRQSNKHLICTFARPTRLTHNQTNNECRIHPWGWRLSLSLAGIPAALLTVGSLLVVETPNSLIERGRLEEGKAVLKRIRGTENVDPEFNEIVEASRAANQVKHPFRNLLLRRNRPQLVIAILLQVSIMIFV